MLHFIFDYKGMRGDVHAASLKQALDRIKVHYLDRMGIKPSDPRFRLQKSQLTQPWKVNFAEDENEKFRRLYKAAREDAITHEEQQYMDTYRQIAQDLIVLCPNKNLRPTSLH